MSEKKPEKKSQGKPSFLRKVGLWCQRVFWLSFKNMWAELKKVSWPSRKELTNYSIVVLSFMVLMAIVIGLLDTGASELIRTLIQE